MRVLVIARGFPTSADPENGIFEYEHALTLSKRGVKVSYVFIDRRIRVNRKVKRAYGLCFHKHDLMDIYGGYLLPVTYKLFPRLAKWLYTKRYLRATKRIIEVHGCPDIIQCHYLFNLPCAVAIKNKYNIPLIMTEHWSQLAVPKNLKCVEQYSKYYKCADEIISVSNSLNYILGSKYNINSSVIYNLVSDDFWDKIKKKSKNRHFTRFVSIGSLCHRKGYDLLINALYEINKQNVTNWSMTIIGDGSLEEKLLTQIEELSLTDKIKLVGRKNRSEIKEYLSSSDVFVLASRHETFGVVYIEAMSYGLPVIATICGGPEEFVTSDVGVLIPKDNQEALVQSLLHMMNHYDEYDSDYIYHYCKDNFSSDIIIQKYIHIYDNAIKRNML